MKRLGVIQRFALLSLLCIGVLSVALSLTLTSLLTTAVSEWEWENTAAFVRGQVEEHELQPFFTDPALRENRPALREEFGRLIRFGPDVVRVKAWDREGTILWSDDERLVGKKSPDNRELQDALAGKVAVRMGQPDKSELASEREQFAALVEIYVPIFSPGDREVIGVLEVYKLAGRLFSNIRQARGIVWAISLAGGLLFYLTLLPVMRHTYRTEVQLQRSLAEHASRLEETVEARTRELAALNAATATLSQSLDPQEVLDFIVASACRLLEMSLARIWVFDETKGELTALATSGDPDLVAFPRSSFRPGEGFVGRVFETREAIAVTDPARDPRYLQQAWAREKGLTAVAFVPLLRGDRALGVLTAARRIPSPFSAEELKLLTSYAASAAIALDNARLHDRTKADAQFQRSAREITLAVSSTLDLDDVLLLVCREMVHLFQVDGAYLWTLDEAAQELVAAIASGHKADLFRGMRVSLQSEGSLSVRAVKERKGCYINRIEESELAGAHLATLFDSRSLMALPLTAKGKIVGAIVLSDTHRADRFDEPLLQQAELVATQAAIAIENARLFAAREQATQEARSLYEVAHSLTTSLDPTEVLHLVSVKAVELLGTLHAQVVLWDEATQSLRLGATHGTEADKVQRQQFRLGEGVNGVVAQTRAPLVVNDYQAWPHRVPGFTELVAVVGVPLLHRGRFLGVLTSHATQPGRPFTQDHLALLTSFADQAAIALENARLYEEIQRHAADLEVRVRGRTAALEEANRRLAEALRVKSEFLATMSHEFQTPLNAIIGFSEMLQGQAAGLPDEKHRRYLANIHQSGQRLSRLLRDILELSRLEREPGSLELEEVALPALLEDLKPILAPPAASKHIALAFRIEPRLPPIMADPVQIKKVLYHLLSNAIKFTPSGGTVCVAARRADDSRARDPGEAAGTGGPHGECVQIAVQDTGIGIKAEDLPRLFQPFTHLEPALSKQQQGAGLGLGLAKRLVELHGGRIRAESEGEGRGSTFTVVLPVAGPGR